MAPAPVPEPGAPGAPGVTVPDAEPLGFAGSRCAMFAAGGGAPPSFGPSPPTLTTIRIAVGTTATAVTAEMAMARSVRRFTRAIQHQVPHW
ncbi:hypothetical protein [Actinomadura madurae]|uniref:hypothetical protein n=1 Tax=Actinomadura madurae TaxID=1993 RepID=UPI0020D227F2|nr:hypothetical protein [Actinomadura madurae]MCQ0018434.1 hypothetical protein [Actinomadura madurae]